ncbi:transglycosylase SLT domain-containing protein [Nocardia sp. SC052]|uniref:lytic transglycosylase domain-containing protein n=1 Tax=Nocardia sichangensis TaxID=3385975 RepID=UPI0039A24A42
MANYTAGTADVEIGPNFSNFVRKLREDLERVEAELGVEIKPDFTNFAQEVEDYLKLVRASLDVEINPDLTDFANELALHLALIHEALDVKVGVDQTSLDNLETLIRAKLAAMDLHVDVRVGADTSMAYSQISMFRMLAGEDIDIDVHADTAAAQARIAALNGQTVTVNVATNGGRSGSGALSGFGGAAMLNAGALGIASLPAGAAALSSVGIEIQALAQNAALLPAIFAGAAAGIGTLVVGLNGMKDAFADGKKGMEAYNNLDRQGRALVDTVKRNGKEWEEIQKRIQGITLNHLSQPLDHMLKVQMPALERGMTATAGAMNRGSGILLNELGSDKSVASVDRVFGNTAKSADILNTAIKPIISSVETLAGVGSDKLPILAQGFANAATRLDAFLTRADNSGDLSRWMNEGIDAGKELLSIIGNLGSSLASFLRAGKGEGDGFLTTVDKLTERMAVWLKSPEGQADLRVFFREGREQLDGWMPILQSVGGILKSVYEASQAWSAILLPFLRAGAELLDQHDGLLKTLMISYLAFRTINPIFTMLRTGWVSASAAVDRYVASQAAASGAGAGALRSSAAGLAGMLGAGGIFGLALGGAALGLGLLATKHQEAAQAAEDQRRKLEALRETLDEQTGAVTKETITSTTKDLENRGFLERAQTLGVDPRQYVQAGLGLDQAGRDAINARLTRIILEQTPKEGYGKLAFESAAAMPGMDAATVAQALQGIPEAVKKFEASTMAARAQGARPADLAELKEQLNDIGESAATLGGEMNGLGTNTGRAAEAQRRINETLNDSWQLTEQGKKSFEELGAAVIKVPNEKTVWVKAPPGQDPADFKARLEEMGRTVELLPDGTLKIFLDDAAAKAQIQQIVKPETKNVLVHVVDPNGINSYTPDSQAAEHSSRTRQDPASYPRAEDGRRLPGRAHGGPITGGIPGQDSVPILGMPGEHMLTTSDVDKLGGQAGVYRFRAALQAGLVRPMRTGGAVGWTEEDEIKLQKAQNAITQAEEDLRVLDFKKNVSPGDRRAAELKVDEARNKAQQLEDKKAGRGGPTTEVFPQQALPGRRSNAELDREDADAAVDAANTKRNQVYNDPNATDEDRRAADRDYQRAQNRRAETYKSSAQSGSGSNDIDISLPGIAAKGAGILAEGILSALGLENSILSGNNVYTRSVNTALNFYAGKAREQQPGETGDYDYQPKNLPVDRKDSTAAATGTSGESATSAEYNPSGGVEQWRGAFAQVLRALAMPADWLSLGLAQMQTESGGNPKAINLWDSNAQKGTPSKGLMQVIDPTFQSYKSALYPADIWDPGANIAASLRYTVARYGSPVGVWGQGHGYADGGWVLGIGGPRDDANRAFLSRGEFVMNADAAAAYAPELEAMNAGLPLPVPPLPSGMVPRGGDTTTVRRDSSINFHGPIQLNDPHELMREMERHQAIAAQGEWAGLPG